MHRRPWPPDFPDVVVHMHLKARNRHPAYAAGKSGDAMAAYAFVTDVLNEESFKRKRQRKPSVQVMKLMMK